MDLHTLKKQILISRDIKNWLIDRECGSQLTQNRTNKQKKQRKDWIKELKPKGLILDQRGNTIYTRKLSPGCQLCKKGRCVFLYVTSACNRKCFFCPIQPESITQNNESSLIEGKEIKSKQDLVHSIDIFKAEGCGITGGEPLLVMDRTIQYISWMKEAKGPSFYIWLYTNGDLLDEKILTRLKNSGLDEIRFNLAANGYQTRIISLAQPYFNNITVEIPAIPKDERQIVNLVVTLERLGVNYLNLHELVFSYKNITELKKREYVGVHIFQSTRGVFQERPVLGSENSAFRILQFAIQNELSLPINYCSLDYKNNIQIPDRRKAISSAYRLPHERVTKDGYCEKIVIYESKENIDKIMTQLKKHIPRNQIHLSPEKERLEIHPDYLKYLKLSQYEVGIVKSFRMDTNAEAQDIDIRII